MATDQSENQNTMCTCGHALDEHGVVTNVCLLDCDCLEFKAAEDDEWDGDEDRE